MFFCAILAIKMTNTGPVLGIVDYGAGNLYSVEKLFRYLGCSVRRIDTPSDIANSDGVILPGVGAFGYGMHQLNQRGFVAPILDHIQAKKPFIGLCLGFQLLFESSAESPGASGLGVFPGHIEAIDNTQLVVPHMGWNQLHDTGDSPYYLQGIDRPLVYFVHSYWLQTIDPSMGHTQTNYGQSFVSSIWTPTVFAAQFHPEKSGQVGVQLLRNVMRHFAHLK